MNSIHSTVTTLLPTNPLRQLPFHLISYLTSPYATIVSACVLVSKRIQIMAAPSYIPQDDEQSDPATIKLPLLPTLILRLLVVVPLLLHLSNIRYGSMPEVQLGGFLIRSLLLLAFSNVVEIFLAVTSNLKVMLVRDYSLFEMSLQCYFFMASRRSDGDLDKILVLLETYAAVMHNLLVHVVRLFELRRYRLWLSLFVYFLWSVAALCLMVMHGSNNDYRPASLLAVIVSYIRFWSRIPSMFIVVMFTTKILWEMFWYRVSGTTRSMTLVQRGLSSFNEIRAFVRNNTSEEFVVFTFKFAEFLLLRSSPYPNTTVVDDMLVDLNDSNQEYTLGSAKSGGSLNRLNCTSLSGYLNKVMTVPEDVSTLDKAGSFKTQTEDIAVVMMPTLFKRFQCNARLFKHLSFKLRDILLGPSVTSQNDIPRGVTTSSTNLDERHEQYRKIDLNRYVTPTNYSRFLCRFNIGNPSEVEAIQKYLLPETDTSPDYTVPSLDSPTEYRRALKTLDLQEYIPTEDDTEEIREELHELLRDTNSQIVNNPELLTWYSSVHSILKYELQHDKSCMTRSQYARENPEAVLNEVIFERCPLLRSVDRQYVEELPEDAQDERDYCVVCLAEPRNVVLLPCRCLAICDGCRVALGSRGFKKCVCCDTEVGAYIRVNVV